MKSARHLLVTAVICAIPLCPQELRNQRWPQEPDGFQRLKFGDTAEAVMAKITMHNCIASGPYRMCESSTSIGPSIVNLRLIFLNKGLAWISGIFPADSFADLRPIFLERYGPPGSVSNEPLNNAFGATFENEHLSWMGDKVSLTLLHYYKKLSEGNFTLCTKEYLLQVQKDETERLKEDARKL